MKNVLIITSAVLLSTAAQAENEIVNPEAIKAGQETISNSAPSETGAVAEGAVSELVQVNNELNSADLWKTLDTNEDGSISKEEAASSKEVVESWDNLDVNKDEQLDSEEFAQLFPSEK